ncbi:MAG: histidinol dehydrogenase [Microbacterium sp.]
MSLAWPSRILLVVVALIAGVVFGVAGTISHAFVWGILPVGLIVGAIGCAAVLLALRLLVPGRWATLAAGVGMVAALLVYSGEGPGGSVVVAAAADGEIPWGIIWTVTLIGIVLIALVWPERVRRAPVQEAPRRIDE